MTTTEAVSIGLHRLSASAQVFPYCRKLRAPALPDVSSTSEKYRQLRWPRTRHRHRMLPLIREIAHRTPATVLAANGVERDRAGRTKAARERTPPSASLRGAVPADGADGNRQICRSVLRSREPGPFRVPSTAGVVKARDRRHVKITDRQGFDARIALAR